MQDSIIITIINDPDEDGPENLLRPYAPMPVGMPVIYAGEDMPGSPFLGHFFIDEEADQEPIEFLEGVPAPGHSARGPIAITIEPRNAFGDGRHATTLLCVRFLLEHLGEIPHEKRANLSLLDAGAGTGVLSITASRLGVGRIDAVEVNRHAVECATHNIGANDCGNITLHESDIASFDPGLSYDIVTANLVTDVIIAHIEKLTGFIRPGGTLIASGVSDGRDESVRREFLARGLMPVDFSKHDGWCGYVMKKG